jgi:hypothetical protein
LRLLFDLAKDDVFKKSFFTCHIWNMREVLV